MNRTLEVISIIRFNVSSNFNLRITVFKDFYPYDIYFNNKETTRSNFELVIPT